MKLKYEKPRIMIESFQLDTAIAACSTGAGPDGWMKMDFSKDACTYDAGGGQVFFSDSNDNCNEWYPEDYDYCYNADSAGTPVFAS